MKLELGGWEITKTYNLPGWIYEFEMLLSEAIKDRDSDFGLRGLFRTGRVVEEPSSPSTY
jgi:hypothetical protein